MAFKRKTKAAKASPHKKRRPASKRRRMAGVRRGAKLTVQVHLPPTLTLNGPELSDLSQQQRLELADLGSKRRANVRPSWVECDKSWRQAFRLVSPHWARYPHPYAAVAYAYQRIRSAAGPARSAHHSARQASGRGAPGGSLPPGTIVNVAEGRYNRDGHSGLHTVVGTAGADYLLVRGSHPHATADEYEVAINKSRVTAARSGPRKRPAARNFRPGSGGLELEAEAIELDDLGYDPESGKYYGLGAPLFRVVNADIDAEPQIDTVVRAPNARAAVAQVAQAHRH